MYDLLNALHVARASLSSLSSSSRLYFNVGDDFKLVNLSNVIGSTTQDDSVFTRLMAT